MAGKAKNPPSDPRRKTRWGLWLARILWVLNLLGNVIVLVNLAPRNVQEVYIRYRSQFVYSGVYAVMDPTQGSLFILSMDILVILTFMLLAMFLVWKKPDDLMAIFTSALFIGVGGVIGSIAFMESSILHLTNAFWLEALQSLMLTISFIGYGVFIFLFPDGRFAPPILGRIFVLYLVIGVPGVFVTAMYFSDEVIYGALVIFFTVPLLSAFASQVYRYRRQATLQQRQQMKLVIAGFTFYPIAGILLDVLISPFIPVQYKNVYDFLSQLLTYAAYLVIPLALTVSIARQRLWDIDILIRRTLVYSLLSGLLGIVYFGGVALLQAVLPIDRSKPSPVIIVITTLAIAALFNPLRKRIQEFIDRRFYRKKYDAEQALAEFAVTARNETDIGRLSACLTSTVQETLQPEQVSLWMPAVNKRYSSIQRHTVMMEEPGIAGND